MEASGKFQWCRPDRPQEVHLRRSGRLRLSVENKHSGGLQEECKVECESMTLAAKKRINRGERRDRGEIRKRINERLFRCSGQSAPRMTEDRWPMADLTGGIGHRLSSIGHFRSKTTSRPEYRKSLTKRDVFVAPQRFLGLFAHLLSADFAISAVRVRIRISRLTRLCNPPAGDSAPLDNPTCLGNTKHIAANHGKTIPNLTKFGNDMPTTEAKTRAQKLAGLDSFGLTRRAYFGLHGIRDALALATWLAFDR